MERRIVLTVVIVWIALSASAPGAADANAVSRSTYVFEVDRSNVIVSGGFAGIYEVYSVEGRFELTLGPGEGSAFFGEVDAKVNGDGIVLNPEARLDAIFNMTELTGVVVSASRIEFEGPAGWGDCRVELTLTYESDSVHLTGETIPPSGSADFFYFALDAVACEAEEKYCGGEGTADNPYLICDANQLNQVAINGEDWDKHFKLTADIDLSVLDYSAFPIGTTFDDSPFCGVFDGDGHTISNFSLDRVEMDWSNTGLFGVVRGQGSAVKDVGIIDPNVRGAYCVGGLIGLVAEGSVTDCYVVGGSVYSNNDENVGGLIGNVCCGSTVSGCYAATTVSGDEAVGGLIGKNFNGTVMECYSRSSATGDDEVGGLVGVNSEGGEISRCRASGAVFAEGDGAGGLVGTNSYGSTVSHCYSLGSVRGESRAGGLVGANVSGSAIAHCYSAGSVSGDSDTVGGLVGFNYEGEISRGYWDRDTSGMDVMCGFEGGGGTGCDDAGGKTTAEMMRESTFPDWDFIGVWNIGEDQTYPYLRVHLAGDMNHDGVVNFLDVAILGAQWASEGIDH